MKGMCGRCYDDEVELVEPTCNEKPETFHGPIGQYHCPDCGAMVIAGLEHPTVCLPCSKREHPYFDRK